MKKFLMCGLLVLTLVASGLIVSSASADDADTVSTAADLQAWFDAHADSGGTVTLGGDIRLYAGDSLRADYLGADGIDVYMGDYHIYVDGGALSLSGNVVLIGEGCYDGAALISEISKGNVSLNGLWIQATGANSSVTGRLAVSVFGGADITDCTILADGNRATALTFRDDGNSADAKAKITGGGVTVYGNNSTAVLSDLPFYVYSATIAAPGKSSVPISAPIAYLSDDTTVIPGVTPTQPVGDTASNTAELQAWFDAYTGGGNSTVTLMDNIYVDADDPLCVDYLGSGFIRIEMGDYHIYVDGGTLSLSGNISFVGQGVGEPLLSEISKGSVSLKNGVMVSALSSGNYYRTGCCAVSVFGGAELSGCSIWAYGDQATALVIKDDALPVDGRAVITGCAINVFGLNTTAVSSELPFYAYSSQISVGGGDSTAVVVAPETYYSDDTTVWLMNTQIWPAPQPVRDTASNFDELNAWLEQNRDTGGTVTLTGDIHVNEDDKLYTTVSAPITIDAEQYTVYLNGGYLLLSGPVTLEGGAGASPLIDEVTGSSTEYTSNIRIYNGACVTALDRDAIRGAADISINGASVSAVGDGVTALYIDGSLPIPYGFNPAILYLTRITASGVSAKAIHSDLPLSVSLCVVTADGDGAVAIDASSMHIFCSKVVDPLPGSYVITGPVVADDMNFLEVPIDISPEEISLPSFFYCYLGSAPYQYPAQWDISHLNTSAEGTYDVPGTADSAPSGMSPSEASIYSEIGLQIPQAVLTVKVSPPRRPEFDGNINDMQFDPWMNSLFICFNEPLDSNGSAFYMWDDAEGRWVDITASGQAILFDSGVEIFDIQDDMSYGFKFIAGGNGVVQGESDSIWIKIADGIPTWDPGGDRSGTDRGGAAASNDGQSPAPPPSAGTSTGGGTRQAAAQPDTAGYTETGSQQDAGQPGAISYTETGDQQDAGQSDNSDVNPDSVNQQLDNGNSGNVTQRNGSLRTSQSNSGGDSGNSGQPDVAGSVPDNKTAAGSSGDNTTLNNNRPGGQPTTGPQNPVTQPPASGQPIFVPGQSAPAPAPHTGLVILISLGAAVCLGGALFLIKAFKVRR